MKKKQIFLSPGDRIAACNALGTSQIITIHEKNPGTHSSGVAEYIF